MDCKEIKPVNTKGNESWIFIGGTDAEAEAPIFRPPDVKSRLTGKDPDDGKDWRHEEKGMTENEMVGWHHWLNGHEFKQAPGDAEGQGSLAWCNPWGSKKSDTTDFCLEKALVIANTLFQQYKRQFYTWTSSDSQYRNQLDYIICSSRWRFSIQSAKKKPGADCGSGHELLIAKFRLKLKRVEKTTRPFRYDLNQIPYDYTVEVRNRCP